MYYLFGYVSLFCLYASIGFYFLGNRQLKNNLIVKICILASAIYTLQFGYTLANEMTPNSVYMKAVHREKRDAMRDDSRQPNNNNSDANDEYSDQVLTEQPAKELKATKINKALTNSTDKMLILHKQNEDKDGTNVINMKKTTSHRFEKENIEKNRNNVNNVIKAAGFRLNEVDNGQNRSNLNDAVTTTDSRLVKRNDNNNGRNANNVKNPTGSRFMKENDENRGGYKNDVKKAVGTPVKMENKEKHINKINDVISITRTRVLNGNGKKPAGNETDVKTDGTHHVKGNESKVNGTAVIKIPITPNNSSLRIEATSSKSNVSVSVDGSVVFDTNSRGISVVVMNQFTGFVMAYPTFDTYGGDFGEVIEFVNTLKDGRLVVFTVGDEASLGLKKKTRLFLANMGGRYALRLGYRHTWVFACIKGGKALAECYNGDENPCSIAFEHNVETKQEKCNYKDNASGNAQKLFCSRYEGFGQLCNCTNPLDTDVSTPLLRGTTVNLPIAVMASNRPIYLFRMIKSLISTPGVNRTMVTVFIDGFFEEPADVAALFHLNHEKGKRICTKNCGIQQHYKRSLTRAFDKYPDAKYLIILEEDLDISPDIMDYFSQLLPVLASDESLYCISAWNDQGYHHSSNDPAMLYRVETMPGLGWLLKRKLYKDELEPQWPNSETYWDWDMWMRLDVMKKGRECIIPDISRTFHFGKYGVNMYPDLHEAFFKNHSLNQKTGNRFDISKMTKNEYESEMHELIKDSKVLDHSKNPCSHNDFLPNTTNQSYVVFIKQKHGADFETWLSLCKCFNIWNVDARGFHKMMFRLWWKKNRLFVVGSMSPYAVHKPHHVTPLYLPQKKEQ